jgi:predicted dehydrogenase
MIENGPGMTNSATSLNEINVGVVGTGFMGVTHVQALRRLGINVKGIVGSTPERARAKAAAVNLPHVFDSLEALLADSEIDAIHITSPNHLHHEQVVSVIGSGKHVICEKPLAVTVDEGADLVGRAKASGVVHAVCFNQRYYPLVHQAHTMVSHGDLGDFRLVSGGYLQDWLLFETDWNWRLVGEKGGALRAVADIGSHWFDNIEFITGTKLTEVLGDLHTFHKQRNHPTGEVETFSVATAGVARVVENIESDDAAGVLLRFENGARGTCTISQVSAGRKNYLNWEIDCANSALSWNTENPEDLWIGHRGQPNQILKRDPGLLHPVAGATAGFPGGHVEGYPDTFRALFTDVYAHILNGGQGPAHYPTFDDGLRSLRVCDAVATSSREGRWVTVG